MSNWTFVGDDVAIRVLGVLALHMTPQPMSHSPYARFELSLTLRDGVSIGRMIYGEPLAKLTVMASTEFLARLDAEKQAEKWLAAHFGCAVRWREVQRMKPLPPYDPKDLTDAQWNALIAFAAPLAVALQAGIPTWAIKAHVTHILDKAQARLPGLQ